MAMELKQSIRLSQQLLMTPQLQQAIKILQLSRIELAEYVEQQIKENPLIEDLSEQEFVQIKTEREELGRTTQKDFAGERFTSQKIKSSAKEEHNFENYIAKEKTLTEHLIAQLFELELTDQEKAIAIVLLGNLDQNGYLFLDLEKFSAEENLSLQLIEGVLDTIQRLDPLGVCARNLQECLSIQARSLYPKDKILKNIILNFMKEVEGKKYQIIAKSLGEPLQTIYEKIKLIEKMEPRPARPFVAAEPIYVVPDAYVMKIEDEWKVFVNDEGLAHLAINPMYKELLQKKSTREYLSTQLKSANWLFKCLKQRQDTILKVVTTIVEKQKEFFQDGPAKLKPMTLRDVAEKISMHESTVSRVTHNKYIQTPRGVFELKYFFNSKISAGEEDASSEAVRNAIKKIIGEEPPKKPYSDQALVGVLQKEGFQIARRTVAKYREQLNILPSAKRKKIF